jgi:hypothetical protein
VAEGEHDVLGAAEEARVLVEQDEVRRMLLTLDRSQSRRRATTPASARMSGTPGLYFRRVERSSGFTLRRDHASSCANVGQSAGRKCDSDSERSTVCPRLKANC